MTRVEKKELNKKIKFVEKCTNVFTCGYLPLTYWKNWFENIAQFFRNIKYAWQRAVKGYCDRDVWGLQDYYNDIFFLTLNHLAEYGYGHPCDFPGGQEGWEKYLTDLAERFYKLEDDYYQFDCEKQADAIFEKLNALTVKTEEEKEDGSIVLTISPIEGKEEEYKDLQKAWQDKLQETHRIKENFKNETFELLKKHYFELWD